MNDNAFGRWFNSIPPVTKNLLIINIAIWLIEFTMPGFCNTLLQFCALHYFKAPDFNPVQFITYMFMHDNRSITHIFFNMFSLWMFGRILEQVWGSRRFLIYYFVCGIGAAIVQEIVWAISLSQFVITNEAYYNMFITIGASGAIFGLLMGFAFVFPNLPMYLFFIPIPIKAKYMAIGYGVIEFFLGVAGGGTIAHFAHLGGLLFGLIILLIWKKKGTLGGNNFY